MGGLLLGEEGQLQLLPGGDQREQIGWHCEARARLLEVVGGNQIQVLLLQLPAGVSYQNVNTSATNINYVYSFPIIRLSDLYLLYAEALNELNETPTTDVYYYVQQVRNKAGLDEGGSLVNTWRNHSNRPDKPTTQRGMREIIQKERMIELAFEGHRYHDVRRWKLGSTYLNTQIKGWSVLEQDPEYFYNARVLFTRKFMPRDYLWPIKTNSINRNPKLVQNPQW